MRICILASPRSGSRSLMSFLSKNFKLKVYDEPYNIWMEERYAKRHLYKEDIWHNDNILVKHMVKHLPLYKLHKLDNYFDKIICLYRNNYKASAESRIQAEASGNWTDKYTFNNINYDKKKLNYYVSLYKEEVRLLKNLGHFSISYEELFYSGEGIKKVKSYFNITNEKHDSILNPKNRYRQNLSEDSKELL